MSAPDKVAGCWLLAVMSGGHRILGCVSASGDEADAAELRTVESGLIDLVEAYELSIVPTPKGLAVVVSPYGMVPHARPSVRIENIQTMVFRHELDDKARQVFDGYIKNGRDQTVAASAALSGIHVR